MQIKTKNHATFLKDFMYRLIFFSFTCELVSALKFPTSEIVLCISILIKEI